MKLHILLLVFQIHQSLLIHMFRIRKVAAVVRQGAAPYNPQKATVSCLWCTKLENMSLHRCSSTPLGVFFSAQVSPSHSSSQSKKPRPQVRGEAVTRGTTLIAGTCRHLSCSVTGAPVPVLPGRLEVAGRVPAQGLTPSPPRSGRVLLLGFRMAFRVFGAILPHFSDLSILDFPESGGAGPGRVWVDW